MRHLTALLVTTALALAPACGDDEPQAATDAGAATELPGDAGPGDTGAGPADAGGGDAGTTDAGPGDASADTADAALPPLALQPTIAAPAADPLAAGGVESCAVYQQELCSGGTLKRCDLYDTAGASWVDAPDPLLHRVLLYDRRYDLFASPSGQCGEPVFTEGMPAATPEAVWGDPAKLAYYAGRGDSAIWTGVAATAAAFRYAVTGTQADYDRMIADLEVLLTKFDVTGVPGYLSRYYYLQAPDGAPRDPEHFIRYEGSDPAGKRDVVMADPASVPGLPAAYTEGLDDGAGGKVAVTAMWNGHPSIDQYTGPMVAFPVAWDLVKDEALKQRMADHLVCYLNRLQRIEIRNLQGNPEIKALVTDYFAGTGLNLDPDDIDLTAGDTVVAFVNRGLVQANVDTFDRSCPDGPPLEADVVMDAAADDFALDLIALITRLGDQGEGKADQLDHVYAPTLRGGDASHMMHLAAMAYRFTGDDRYRAFLFEELIGNLDAVGVALTMQAFRSPDVCLSYYGDHITYGTHWQLLSMLPPGELRDAMVRVMHEELWDKALHNHQSAKFNIMYAASGDSAALPARDTALAQALAQLEGFGGPVGFIDAPRRTYDLPRQAVVDAMTPLGIGVRCPTEQERTTCEEGITVMGITLAQDVISYDCDGRPAECVMADGKCVEGIADDALPAQLRKYADFMWQRSPFHIGEPHAVDGQKQSPGRDLSEPYWMARYYGYLTEGAGQVLAWRDQGACN